MNSDPWYEVRSTIENCERFVTDFDGSADERERLRVILTNASGMEGQLRSAGTPMASELASRCSALQSKIRSLL